MKYNFKTCFQVLNLLLIGMVILSSCSKDDDDDPSDNLVEFSNIEINGAEEVPPNNSTATGIFNGTYDKTTKILTYTLTYSGVMATNMHFHEGAVGVSGPVVIPIGEAPFSSPINDVTPVLTEEQEADLLAGNWYVNIHSEDFPPGEIRGQVVQ
ncbi:MAG: CHRD domain-containing protein [Anditalea sp.]